MSLLAYQDPTLLRTGSSCPGSQHRPSTVAFPYAQACHIEPKQLFSDHGATRNSAVSSVTWEWLLTWSPLAGSSPASTTPPPPASPAAAGNSSGGSRRKRRRRRRRKAAAALGSRGALKQVWTPGSRDCSRITVNPSPGAPATLTSTRSPYTHQGQHQPNASPLGLPSLFPTQPSPFHSSIQPCEPQAAAAKLFTPSQVGSCVPPAAQV